MKFFNIPSGRSMALVFAQPLAEMSTRKLPASKERPAHKDDNFTPVSRLSRNEGASTSHKPMDLYDLLWG
jgi:hypothetical protein